MTMPGLIFHVGATCTCSHGGQLQVTPARAGRVLVSGQPVVTSDATLTVLGCPGVSGAVCSAVRWVNHSARVLAGGSPMLLQAPFPVVPPAPGNGLVAGPPPNTPLVMAAQARVVAS